jgi:hypothetical protein
MGRDVDRLDPMPDGKLYEQDQAYLVRVLAGLGCVAVCVPSCTPCTGSRAARGPPAPAHPGRAANGRGPSPTPHQEQHGVGPLFSGLLADIARTMPADPVQFMIDSLTLGPEQAEQVGAPVHRHSRADKPAHSMAPCTLLHHSCADTGRGKKLVMHVVNQRFAAVPNGQQMAARAPPIGPRRAPRLGCPSTASPSWRRCSAS